MIEERRNEKKLDEKSEMKMMEKRMALQQKKLLEMQQTLLDQQVGGEEGPYAATVPAA